MEIFLKYLLILTLKLFFIINKELNGVYNIKSLKKSELLTSSPIIYRNNYFLSLKRPRNQNFRITPINSDVYIIESIFYEKKLGVAKNDDLVLLDNDIIQYWNFIKVNDNEFLIQNNNTKKFLKTGYCPKCSINLEDDDIQKNNFDDSLKFTLLKLYEEVKLKPEHMKFIEEEPVDVLIKYIDLTDKNLNREGIQQIKKDEDHEELRYCVRSILDNIPWIRKIFILMPNEKVTYFKPIEEIKDKIVYLKDIDLMGYDTANIYAFHLALHNMSKFGMSDNFILMDDDYFIGKPINKSRFFYYDEKEEKVVPSIISDEYSEIIKDEIYKEYKKLLAKSNQIDPHTSDGWYFHTYLSFKVLLDNFESPLINACFTHNAVPLNLKDIKEVYEFLKTKYEFFNITLYSKTRPVFCLQSHTLFNDYSLNVKKRKVSIIPRMFYDLNEIKKFKDLIKQDFFIIMKKKKKSFQV